MEKTRHLESKHWTETRYYIYMDAAYGDHLLRPVNSQCCENITTYQYKGEESKKIFVKSTIV